MKQSPPKKKPTKNNRKEITRYMNISIVELNKTKINKILQCKGLIIQKESCRETDRPREKHAERLSYRETLSGSSNQGAVQNKTKYEVPLKGIWEKHTRKNENDQKER